MKFINTLGAIGFATAIALSFGSAASAKADLVFMHNASPYFVWSNYEQCKRDLNRSGNPCKVFGNKRSYCGKNLYSNSAPSNVAKMRWKRRDYVQLFHNGTNNKFCKINP